MPRDDLKHLPMQVKVLVNDGVYSLYRVKNRDDLAYVLITNAREIYALTEDGAVAPGVVIRDLKGMELEAPAFFTGLDHRRTLKLNFA